MMEVNEMINKNVIQKIEAEFGFKTSFFMWGK